MSDDIPRFSKIGEELIRSLRRIPDEGTGARLRETKPVATLMQDLVVKHSIGMSSPEQTIRDHWPAIVGPANAHYSHAAQIDPKGRIIILVPHAVVRNELFLHRASIVQKLRKLPGCAHVRELHLRAG